jgi:hypothetical protein
VLFLILSNSKGGMGCGRAMRCWLDKFIAGGLFAATGICFAIYVVGVRVLNPFDVSWLKGDPATGYLGWKFFRQEDHLTFPLGWASSLGYPLGEPIAYLDSMPLVASVLWPFRHSLPSDFQYFGAWFALCVILQFYFGYRISRRLTGGYQPSAILGGLLFMAAPPFIWRSMEHFALTNHWLILAALDFYLAAARKVSRGQMVASSLLCFAAGGINPYIAAMVLLVLSAAYLRGIIVTPADPDRALSTRILFAAYGIGISLAGAISALLIFGFLRPGDAGSYSGAGYKIYSMNLLALIDPMRFPGLLLDAMPVLSSDQHEGYNYLGLGVISLGIVASAWRPSILTTLFRREAIPGWFILVVSLFLALSLKASVGSVVAYNISAPDVVLNALRAFRASGRLFWPAYYLILCCVIGASYVAFGDRARTALLLAFFVQMFDLRSMHIGIGEGWSVASSAVFTDDPIWQDVGRSHRHLVVFPAWQCGSDSPGRFQGYWIFGKLAAEHGMTINSFYAGRNSRKQLSYFCNEQPLNIEKNGLEANTAYVFNTGRSLRPIRLGDHFCRNISGVLLCSRVVGKTGVAREVDNPAPALPANNVISFRSTDDSAAPFLTDGWSVAEPWGRWTEGASASLIMRVATPRGATLHFLLKPLATASHLQRVELTINGHDIARWSFDSGEEKNVSVDIPPETIDPDGLVSIRFSLPDAQYPQELGLPRDDRRLAIGFISMSIGKKSHGAP